MNNYVKTYLRIGFSWARKWKPGYLEMHGTQPSHWYSVAPSHKEQQSPLLFWAESIYHFPEVSEQKETCTSGGSLVPMLWMIGICILRESLTTVCTCTIPSNWSRHTNGQIYPKLIGLLKARNLGLLQDSCWIICLVLVLCPDPIKYNTWLLCQFCHTYHRLWCSPTHAYRTLGIHIPTSLFLQNKRAANEEEKRRRIIVCLETSAHKV